MQSKGIDLKAEPHWDTDHFKPKAFLSIPQLPQMRTTAWNENQAAKLSILHYPLCLIYSWSWYSTLNMTIVLILKKVFENKIAQEKDNFYLKNSKINLSLMIS